MIKKNTKVVFKDARNVREEEMVGGIPLSKGEIIRVHENDVVVEFEVAEKKIDCYFNGPDKVVDIVYTVVKK